MVFSSFDTLDSEDLSILRQVLEEVCHERSIPIDGAEAAEIARSLVNWYLFGVKEKAALKQMLEPLSGQDAQIE